MTGDVTQADRLCRLFCNVVDEIITTRALEAAVGDGLSRAQFEGLQYVYLHPQCCIKDLARGLDVSHPAAVKLVERLEAKELIARSSFEKDRRVVHLEVTELGHEQAHQTMVARSEAIEKVLKRSGNGTAEELMRALEGFVSAALSDEKDCDGICLRCGGHHVDACPVCRTEFTLTGKLRRDS